MPSPAPASDVLAFIERHEVAAVAPPTHEYSLVDAHGSTYLRSHVLSNVKVMLVQVLKPSAVVQDPRPASSDPFVQFWAALKEAGRWVCPASPASRQQAERMADGEGKAGECQQQGSIAAHIPSCPSCHAARLTTSVPPGSILTLPDGVSLLGRIELGSRCLIRECYSQLLELTRKPLNDIRLRTAIVTGNPGSGKTLMAVFLLMHFHEQGRTIVFEDQLTGERWLLPPTGPIPLARANRADSFPEVMDCQETVFICDSLQGEVEEMHGRTVVLACLHRNHYKRWHKRGFPLLFMPLWSLAEVRAVVPAVYPAKQAEELADDGSVRLDADGKPKLFDAYEQRWRFFGGNARRIFSRTRLTDRLLLWGLLLDVDDCQPFQYIRSAASHFMLDGATEPDVACSILCFAPDTTADGQLDFASARVGWLSDFIVARVAARCDSEQMRELQAFVQRDESWLGQGRSTFRRALTRLAEASPGSGASL